VNPKSASLATFALALLAALAASASRATTIYWDGANAGWDNAANWSTVPNATTPDPAAIPSTNDTAYFSIEGDAGATVTLNGDQSAYGLAYRDLLSNNVKLEGGGTDRTLTIGPGGISSATAQINIIGSTTAGQFVNVVLSASQTWRGGTTGGSQLIVCNAVSREASDTVNRTLLLDVADNFQPTMTLAGTVSNGGVSGTLALWLTGFGIHSLSGINTHTGGTVLNGGQVNITPAAMPASGQRFSF